MAFMHFIAIPEGISQEDFQSLPPKLIKLGNYLAFSTRLQGFFLGTETEVKPTTEFNISTMAKLLTDPPDFRRFVIEYEELAIKFAGDDGSPKPLIEITAK
jgi:hypothetical protein